MRQCILFLEQQSWRSGAERVLDEALRALEADFLPLVAFPEDGAFAAELRRRGVETLLFPLGRYRPGPKSLADMLSFPSRSLYCGFWLAQTILRRHISVVYINSPRCLLAGAIAARLTARPSLFHLHMTMTRRTDLWVAACAARHITKIIACSKTAACSLSAADARLRDSIQVVYNPVRKPVANGLPAEVGLVALLAGSNEPIVGLVGRITPQKGHDVLLKAAAQLAQRGRVIQVVFVGAPDRNAPEDLAYVRKLEAVTRELGIKERVHWAGFQENPNPFYAIFDVLVIPSKVSEGLPLVALEAMQWGVPVIGSRIGGIPEVLCNGVNGFLAPPGDEEALASCLECVLSNAELRMRLQSGARASIDDRFSTESFSTQIRQVLFELSSHGRKPDSNF
ncbi:MAG TPA: glycosyltransferase family 4 protein [Terriglobia bacterium]|nr:glycosyltransferase family 4 protein [Terriglobia bacterium]